jgi:septum formation protein
MIKATKAYRLVLGSGSASRKFLLTEAGYRFLIRKADINEKEIGDRNIPGFENAKDLVMKLGISKADAILNKYCNDMEIQNHILITCDQVVLCNNKILEKPIDIKEARSFIEQYRHNYCQTVGSIVVTDITSRKRVAAVDTSKIYFDDIPDSVIDSLLAEGDVLQCAGGLMVEHALVQPHVNRIEGSRDSLMGLSISLLQSLIDSLTEIY